MAAQDAPREVLDLIFDNFHGQSDNATHLFQCSLVSKSWLSSTRSNQMFRKAVITLCNADDFASLVFNPFSTLPFCIRHLVLDVNAQWLRRLMPFLHAFQSVETLEIKLLDWEEVDPRTQRRFTEIFSPTLRSLLLGEGLRFHALGDALNLISQFYLLERLSIDGATWRIVDTTPSSHSSNGIGIPSVISPTTTNFPSSIQYLHLCNCRMRQVLAWILSQSPTLDIPHLSFTNIRPEDCTQLFILFCSPLGGRIKTLTCSFYIEKIGACSSFGSDIDDSFSYHSPPATSFYANSTIYQQDRDYYDDLTGSRGRAFFGRLETVRIDNFIYYTDPERTGALYHGLCTLGLLATGVLEAPYLRGVTLCVWLKRVGELDVHPVDWRRMDDIIVELAGTLEDDEDSGPLITFEIRGGVDTEAIAALLSARLPRCRAEGLLQFS